MKLFFILFAVLSVAFALATPLGEFDVGEVSANQGNVPQNVALKDTQQERNVGPRDPLAQHPDPPDRPGNCDKCDKHYLQCRQSGYCWTHPFDCDLHCRIETCDWEDCYKCGWKDCTHKNAELDENDGNAIQRRDPLAQDSETASTLIECSLCNGYWDTCMSYWACWFNREACNKECRIYVCMDEDECRNQCGYTDCQVQANSADFLENSGKAIGDHIPQEAPSTEEGSRRDIATQEKGDHDSSDFLANLERSLETRADCNSCKDHYNWCLDQCGSWWSPDQRPKECYEYCEIDTCKYQDCSTTCLTWYKCKNKRLL